MGKMSKAKGYRGEIQLRDALRAEGFIADRMPLSGAIRGYEGDVRFSKPGIPGDWVAEVKVRKDAFKKIYAVFDSLQTGGKLALAVPTIEGLKLFSIHITMRGALEPPFCYYPLTGIRYPTPALQKETYLAASQILKMRPWLGKSDILCIRQDHKSWLFIEYRKEREEEE